MFKRRDITEVGQSGKGFVAAKQIRLPKLQSHDTAGHRSKSGTTGI